MVQRARYGTVAAVAVPVALIATGAGDARVAALALAGLLTGWVLIVAIGPQSAFVLRQGLRRERVLAVVVFCTISDVLLIGGAVAGMGAALAHWPTLVPVARWAGGVFVLCYGLTAACRAWRGGRPDGSATGLVAPTQRTMLTLAVLTWLNPLVYVDMVTLGTLANAHGADRWWFYGGLVAASASWFAGLGYAAGSMSRWFADPRAWRLLDAGIAVTMGGLGAALLVTA